MQRRRGLGVVVFGHFHPRFTSILHCCFFHVLPLVILQILPYRCAAREFNVSMITTTGKSSWRRHTFGSEAASPGGWTHVGEVEVQRHFSAPAPQRSAIAEGPRRRRCLLRRHPLIPMVVLSLSWRCLRLRLWRGKVSSISGGKL